MPSASGSAELVLVIFGLLSDFGPRQDSIIIKIRTSSATNSLLIREPEWLEVEKTRSRYYIHVIEGAYKTVNRCYHSCFPAKLILKSISRGGCGSL